MPNWTPQQLEAIESRGKSLIVCAAAGSGKTAVLVNRITRLACEGCPIDRMLVVTFTNAAASEMRQRISDALSKAAAERPELAAQVTALSRASISTLHRFCGGLLREHFDALGIDPSFRIADEQECAVLSVQAMEDALYACYDVGSHNFLAADACFDQEELGDIALKIHRFMMTRPAPMEWLDQACALCRSDALADSDACALILDDASTQLDALLGDARETLVLCRSEGGPQHYENACALDIALVEDLKFACERGYDALRLALRDTAFATLGRKKKGDVFNEDID